MGSSPSKEVFEFNGNVRFRSSRHNNSEVNISLKKPIDIRLTPHFTTVDKPGNSVLYRLQLRFRDERKDDQNIESSIGSSEESLTNDFSADIEFHEIIKRERKKTTVGIERKSSIIKDNCWTGTTNTIGKEESRLRLTGQLKENSKNESAFLDFDLILCPSELIVPGVANDWSLIGSFYVNNLKEKKSYKWRAAVPQSLNEEE